ncbi:hypothetical protein [Spirosoma fluminis]
MSITNKQQPGKLANLLFFTRSRTPNRFGWHKRVCANRTDSLV